jgi:beta-aspartyl-peptidase (threonine type)
MKPSLIVHGGAWDIPDDAVEACQTGCHRALTAGWSVLTSGGNSLDAIEAAILVLENDPVFDAGLGSHLNLDGKVECDAIVMDGVSLRAGAAAALQRIRNPIRLARKILETCPHMMLVADGAERYAKANGIALCDNKELISPAEWDAWQKCKKDAHAAEHHRGHEQGTVGAVAIDSHGALFAATSTGGTCCKLPGRIGDSPLIGCGCYADLEAGGVSSTGYGEAIMKVVMAKAAVDRLREPSESASEAGASAGVRTVGQSTGATGSTGSQSSRAMQAAEQTIAELARRTKATAGLILLDREGNPGFAFNTPRMAYGYVAADGGFITGV